MNSPQPPLGAIHSSHAWDADIPINISRESLHLLRVTSVERLCSRELYRRHSSQPHCLWTAIGKGLMMCWRRPPSLTLPLLFLRVVIGHTPLTGSLNWIAGMTELCACLTWLYVCDIAMVVQMILDAYALLRILPFPVTSHRWLGSLMQSYSFQSPNPLGPCTTEESKMLIL